MTSQRLKLKDQILDGIARYVKEVQAYSFSSDGEVVKVGNEARPLQKLVEVLDHAFLHGLKHVTPGYWVFVKRFTHKLVIADIAGLDRLATDLGRSRAWLYQSLNEGALESYFRCFLDNDEILKKFYIEHALFRDSERLTLLMTLVSGLDFVSFDLELNVAYFDLVSYIPRSASDPRDLDDTVSLHSNASFESGVSSLVADVDRLSLLGAESGQSVDGSPREPGQARLSVDTDIGDGVKAEDLVPVECPSLTEDTKNDSEEENRSEEAAQTTPNPPNLEDEETQEPDGSAEVSRPLTLDLEVQANNNSSNGLKHVTRNYSTPDFDINMEKVGEQDQNLEVIRIRKKAKRKKRKQRKTGSKTEPLLVPLKLQDPPKRGLGWDRSSSPSSLSVASSCIEEEEATGDAGEGSTGSVANGSECSAMEDDMVDGAAVLASSLPESENRLAEVVVSGSRDAVDNWSTVKETPGSGSCMECIGQDDDLTDCRLVLDDILKRVCDDGGHRGDMRPCGHSLAQTSGKPIRTSVNADTAVTTQLRVPSIGESLMHESFNSSFDPVDRSVIYWQGELTDNSFDAEMASSTPVNRAPPDEEEEDEDVFVQSHKEFDKGRNSGLLCNSDSLTTHASYPTTHQPSLHTDDHKNKPIKGALSGPSDTHQQTTSMGGGLPPAHATSTDVETTPDMSDNSFVQSDMSVSTVTCSCDSLSSGIGSSADSTAASSCPPLTPMTDSDTRSTTMTSTQDEKDTLHRQGSKVSLVTSVEDHDDGFVIVDVVEDGNSDDDQDDKLEGERTSGDGKEASMDPLNSMDVNANDSGIPTRDDPGTIEDLWLDEKSFGAHDAEMLVDNNLKLYLMLEIFKIEDEEFHKLLRLSTGHMEGNLIPAFILLTDQAIYILRKGDRNGRFSTESRLLYNELDYVLIGLNYQSIHLVCKNRRKRFWLTTGSESLTRFFLHSVLTVMRSRGSAQSLCVLTDATAQAIGLKKYVASEEKVEMSAVEVQLYSLVHWEDLLDSSLAADLQLYLPSTKRKGLLHYRTRESFFVGSYWKPAFFKLKHNLLKRYAKKEAEVPDLVIDLGSPDFGGCRRVHQTERPFCFELVLSRGQQPLQLACENELQLSLWLQCICEVVSHQHSVTHQRGPQPNPCQPSCAVLTSRSLLLSLEDTQTQFFRTLARTSLPSISHVERSPPPLAYLLLNFVNSDCDNPWLLYFNCGKELNKFILELSRAYKETTKRELKVGSIQDEKLGRRCSNCQELIMSAWQRSDSLERGRVRGDSW